MKAMRVVVLVAFAAGAVAGSLSLVPTWAQTVPITTVTGTVTANLGTTDNTVLDNIDADLTTIDGRVDGLETLIGTTNTSLSTIDGRVDGIEALLGTIDADTGNLATALGSVDLTEGDDGSVAGASDALRVITLSHYWNGSTWARAGQAVGGSGVIDGDTTRVTIATDDPVNDAAVELAAAINTSRLDVSLSTLPALVAGTANIGDVDVLSIAAGDNNIGNVDIVSSALPTGAATAANQTTELGYLDGLEGLIGTTNTNTANLAASTNHYRTSAGATEDEFQVKGSAGVITGGIVTNTNAAARYLRCADLLAVNTTPGTSTVAFGVAIPGSTTGAGFALPVPPGGVTFGTGITCWLVTGAADTDVAEVAANEIKVNLFYR